MSKGHSLCCYFCHWKSICYFITNFVIRRAFVILLFCYGVGVRKGVHWNGHSSSGQASIRKEFVIGKPSIGMGVHWKVVHGKGICHWKGVHWNGHLSMGIHRASIGTAIVIELIFTCIYISYIFNVPWYLKTLRTR